MALHMVAGFGANLLEVGGTQTSIVNAVNRCSQCRYPCFAVPCSESRQ